MITEIEDFFSLGCGRCDRFQTADCSSQIWKSGLVALREVCRQVGLVEVVKWGHPCYMHAGRNIALIGALRGDFRLNFFHAALLQDPHGVLEKQGPNTAHADSMRFASAAQVGERAAILHAYLREAMAYAEAGTLPPKTTADLEVPDELGDAMAADPELARAFAALTPGRQRSYVINLTSTKSPQTRRTRIARFRPLILAGKGALERV